MKVLILLLMFTFWMPHPLVFASTFVGNGGNAGDVELQVALNEIKETFRQIEREKDDPELKMCNCREPFTGRALCEPLSNLTSVKRDFCSNLLKRKSNEVIELLNSAHKIEIRWTRDDMEAQESGRPRASDAVTDFKTKSIVINQPRFLQMQAYERTFLLTHELFHLTEWNDQPITDEQEIGPYKQKGGGRELLNALAAGLAIEASNREINKKYSSALKRSQGSKTHWFHLQYGITETSSRDNSAFNVERYNSFATGYRYQFYGPWGVSGQIRSSEGKRSILNSIEGSEQQTALGAALNFQWFPGRDPLGFWGQAHFVFGLGVESLSGKYTLKDSSSSTDGSISSTAFAGSCSYYIPFRSGFWAFVNLGYLSHKYNYALNFSGVPGSYVNYDKNLISGSLGVSYAF